MFDIVGGGSKQRARATCVEKQTWEQASDESRLPPQLFTSAGRDRSTCGCSSSTCAYPGDELVVRIEETHDRMQHSVKRGERCREESRTGRKRINRLKEMSTQNRSVLRVLHRLEPSLFVEPLLDDREIIRYCTAQGHNRKLRTCTARLIPSSRPTCGSYPRTRRAFSMLNHRELDVTATLQTARVRMQLAHKPRP